MAFIALLDGIDFSYDDSISFVLCGNTTIVPLRGRIIIEGTLVAEELCWQHNYDLVDMINDQYTLTTLGNDVYESLRLMDNAIKMREKFDTNDKDLLNDISFLYWHNIFGKSAAC